ncbi:HD-like signal output (HDOD) protein [Rubrivivax sp. A210]|uniref:HDOD domain-containing protein n=1 Tax=Rubrivivax sp. A210 TaxID=2772301 RepID=UPI0019187C2E|nr:HDOD domain-containing protein [Rubrivivax sp. A210]CAD5371912.1 HD-like signal output (HDOD) protein [Rubrivivax sp. A210]
MTIESLFATPVALPAVPRVVQQLIHSFSREDVAVDEIASALETDPVLTAKTLRLANSAYFHVSRRVSTVDDALRMLGFAMVRNLVVGCGVVGAFKSVPGLDLPQFWRYSLYTAGGARWLAQAADLNADLAFTVGLTHAVGQLVLHAAAPQEARRLNEECHPLAPGRAALERERLGYSHAEVSAELALRWNFPAEVADPMRRVPDPLQPPPVSPTAALIHIAAWRARLATFHAGAEEALTTCPSAMGEAIGLRLVWLPELDTLGGGPLAANPAMPPLSELASGLDVMLH